MSERDELDEIHTRLLDGVREYAKDDSKAISWYSEGAEHALDTVRLFGYSKPRTITEVVGVNVLTWGSAILTAQGYKLEKLSGGWYRPGVDYAYTPNPHWLPATVLYTPEPSA